MNKRRLVFLGLLSLLTIGAFAQIAGFSFPAASGYQIQSSREEPGRYILNVVDNVGRQYRIDAFIRGTTAISNSVIRLMDATKGWNSLSPTESVISVDTDDIRLRIIPSRLVFNNQSYQSYVPSGLVFLAVGERVEYDFRLKVDAYFIRFQGALLSERSFLERLVTAVEDPQRFVQDNDPEFLTRRVVELQLEADRAAVDIQDLAKQLIAALGRIEFLENRVVAAEGRLGQVEIRADSAEQRLVTSENRLTSGETNLARHDDRLTTNEATLGDHEDRLLTSERRLSFTETRLASHGETLSANEAWLTNHEERLEIGEDRLLTGEAWLANHENRLELGEERLVIGEARLDAGDERDAIAAATAEATESALRNLIAAEAATQTAALDKTAMAIMAELSKSWFFGKPKAIDDGLFNKIVSTKRALPDITVKELAAQFKAEGLKVDDSQIKAVFAVLFGEYAF